MPLMTFKYGDYTHPEGEVNLVRLELTPKFSENGQRIETHYRMHIQGELLYEGQAALDPKIRQLARTYADNYKTAGLYHADGTPTQHVLDTNHGSNLSGNLVEYRSWPKGSPDEYATVRTFYIVIGARFLDADSQLLKWRQNVWVQGTGGPLWRWAPAFTPGGERSWTRQVLNPSTPVRIRQTGYAEGMTVYPEGNVPRPIFPDFEYEDQRRRGYHDPLWRGQRFTNFGVSWAYTMATEPGVNVIPIITGQRISAPFGVIGFTQTA